MSSIFATTFHNYCFFLFIILTSNPVSIIQMGLGVNDVKCVCVSPPMRERGEWGREREYNAEKKKGKKEMIAND